MNLDFGSNSEDNESFAILLNIGVLEHVDHNLYDLDSRLSRSFRALQLSFKISGSYSEEVRLVLAGNELRCKVSPDLPLWRDLPRCLLQHVC
jgi:hypothetical protein